jgi:radical SAM protein with 4Fe4S-binding SPASM domain
VEVSNLAKSKNQEFIIGIHIDSLNQKVYDQVNRLPYTLKSKIEGYQTLLDEGFPPDRIYGCPTLTSQNADTIIELMDWFYSKGAKHVAIAVFRPLGLAKKEGSKWEPTLPQIERAFRYRASVEGKHMLLVGCSDGKYACQSHLAILANGDVVPCLLLPDLSEGNIYKENVLKIIKKAKKKLLLNINVRGPCATCISKLVCYGCRANAHIYLKDITASDPKCFFNPNAPNKCF